MVIVGAHLLRTLYCCMELDPGTNKHHMQQQDGWGGQELMESVRFMAGILNATTPGEVQNMIFLCNPSTNEH